MEKKDTIKRLFLEAFVRELIKNSTPSDVQIQKTPQGIHPSIKPKEAPRIQKPAPQKRIMRKMLPSRPIRKKINASPSSANASQQKELGKIQAPLNDPRVSSIECLGENKEMLVRKEGLVQKTSIILSQKEIDGIINHFSKQTRIPLIKGTFKAALGNLVITAVISEFVGSRFVIQKKSHFRPI